MEFELKQIGQRPVVRDDGTTVMKPNYESVEDAFARYICPVLGVENKKEPRMVEITIPPSMPGGKATKATTKRPCLPSPAHEIMAKAEDLLNQEQDISYRMGYQTGYKDKDEGKPMQEEGLTLPGTHKTVEFLAVFSEHAKTTVQADKVGAIMEIFQAALEHKRWQGYASGYWQGYVDRSTGTMPKFEQWEDPKEGAKQYKW